MADSGEVIYTLRGDDSELEKDLSEAEKKVEKSTKSTGDKSSEIEKETGDTKKKIKEDVTKHHKKQNQEQEHSDEESAEKKEKIASSHGEKLKGLASGTAKAVGAGMLAVGTAVVGIGVSAVNSATDLDKAMNQYISSTDKSTEETERYKKVMEDIYINNYGESFEDIGEAMAAVTKNLGDLNDANLQNVTESAFALRDTFGYEIPESTRAAKAMMDNFGISGEEAMRLIAAGAQNGLDYSGELIDSMEEYQSTIHIPEADAVEMRFQFTCPSDISTADKLAVYEPMVIEADTPEQAYENALNLPYLDGDEEVPSEIAYSLKHDDTKADKTEIEALKTTINSRNVSQSLNYDANFIPNERFIRSISNLRDSEKSKDFEITISNSSGGTIKNAAIVVGLHNTVGVEPSNNILPFQIYDDMFSAPMGFKFFNENGAELPYYIESEADCNYIVDKNVYTDVKTMAVFSDGKIAVYNGTAGRMQISSDDGATWTNICEEVTSTPYRILLPDSQDNLFVAENTGYKLYKYTSADGYMTGTQVIDMEADETKIGSILAEDSDGNLYLGTYQETPDHCVIRKSSDRGDTWTIVFDTTECQHVHNLFINTRVTPNEIFIGLDGGGSNSKAYVSTDAGATWTLLDVPYKNPDYAFRYAGENFYIGTGERLYFGGATLYKTSDYNDTNAYYPLFDNGQGIRDITNVIDGSDDVLIAGGCVGQPVNTEQLFLSEDRGETWETVLMRPYYKKQWIAGKGLRTFSHKGNQILSETSTGQAMRFVYGNGAKTILAVVNVGDIPTTGKTLTLKTGYVASIEKMDEVLTAYENIDGKVADIRICDGYVIDTVSNKRVLTEDTERTNYKIKLGQTSEYKILENHAYKLNGSVNLGKLSRLNFTKGFTVSFLYRKDRSGSEWWSNDYRVIFQTGDTKLVMYQQSICLMSGNTIIHKLAVDGAYINSVNDDYVRVTAYFTADDLPIANMYTDNKWIQNDVNCTEYPITENFSENDFIVGGTDMPNISRIEIYNRVLSYGEICSLTNGCTLITNGSKYN